MPASRRFCSAAAPALLLLLAAAGGRAQICPAPGDNVAALTRTLAGTEQRLGLEAPELLPVLDHLAQLRFEAAAFAEATALRRRALEIARSAHGAESLTAAEAMAALARLYVEQRRYLDAEPLAIIATNILRDCTGVADPVMAGVLADRARIALARGEPVEAQRWAEQALATDRKNGGAAHSERLRVLGATLVAQQKFDQGERVLEQALALDRAGEDRLATARSLAALAEAYLRAKRFSQALPAVEEATLIDQTCLGPKHPLIAEDLHDLGSVYLATGRPADAALAFGTAMRLLETGPGRNMPALGYVELDLAHAEHALGRDDKAQALFTAARRILNAAEDEERDRQRHA
jgi:tetratricopeptide (TPR) repeat protein